uniref:Putative Xaa-Pro aminopeptidase P n=1 Tax=Rhizophora mucronata TaxID=61149 RepID=A0A2P2KSQ0_RHIMU
MLWPYKPPTTLQLSWGLCIIDGHCLASGLVLLQSHSRAEPSTSGETFSHT